MKILGLVLMIPFILTICITMLSLFLISQMKKRGFKPENMEHEGLYDKGFSLGQHLNSLTWLFIILFIIGLLLYCGWIF